MSALPFTPLTITPRATESLRANSPSQREGAGGWVPSVTTADSSPDEPNAFSPSQAGAKDATRETADLESPAPLPPSSPAPLPFTPSDQIAAAILDDFAAQDETLRGIADKYSTTLESLTLWLARPDIKERIFALESACATRARLVVANNLAAIANKLLHLLTESKLDHESTHRVPATTHHAFAARMQSRESARKAANLLLRIARYVPQANPTPPTPRPPNTNPTRKRGVADAPFAPPATAHQPRPIAPPLPAQREVGGEDRLATGQATTQTAEGKDAHLSAHAVQFTAAAPPTNPTRERGVTPAHIAPQAPDDQQQCITPPLPAPRGEVAESARPVRGEDAHERAAPTNQRQANTNPTRERGVTNAHESAATTTLTHAPTNPTRTHDVTAASLPASPSDIPHPTSDIANPKSDIPDPPPRAPPQTQPPTPTSAPPPDRHPRGIPTNPRKRSRAHNHFVAG